MDRKSLDPRLNGPISEVRHHKYYAIEGPSGVNKGEKVDSHGMHHVHRYDVNQRLFEHATFEHTDKTRKIFKYVYDQEGRLQIEVWEEDNSPSVTKIYRYPVDAGLVIIDVAFANGFKTQEQKILSEHTFKHLTVDRPIPLNSPIRLDLAIKDLKRTFANGFFKVIDTEHHIFEAGYHGSGGTLHNRFIYKLNDVGQTIEVNFERPEFDVKAHVQYSYLANGHLSEERFLKKDGEIGTLIQRKYTFDNHDNWVKVIEYENQKPTYIYERDICYH
jgi:hypothetical protein